jgi:hypothetical protein
MNLEIDMAIALIDQTASEDLEACVHAVREGDREAALEKLGAAISNLGSALDALRNIPREAHDIGLPNMP